MDLEKCMSLLKANGYSEEALLEGQDYQTFYKDGLYQIDINDCEKKARGI